MSSIIFVNDSGEGKNTRAPAKIVSSEEIVLLSGDDFRGHPRHICLLAWGNFRACSRVSPATIIS